VSPRPGAAHVTPDHPRLPALRLVVSKRLTLRGFIIIDHQDRMPDMVADVSAWLREGEIAHAETIVDGLDRAPGAFIDLLRGASTGKMLVRL
jgi:hypothetical protein